jgi:hypothetical protein
MNDSGGVPYEDSSPLRCQFDLDDTPFKVRVCNALAAWHRCAWCREHLGIVAPVAFQRLRRAERIAA